MKLILTSTKVVICQDEWEYQRSRSTHTYDIRYMDLHLKDWILFQTESNSLIAIMPKRGFT